MKILHFGYTIPDPRIERIAILGKRLGHKCYFLGYEIKTAGLEENPFEGSFTILVKAKNRLGLSLKKMLQDLKMKIDNIDPDVIHAYDIFHAHFVYLIYPEKLVYDDREYWGFNSTLYTSKKLIWKIPDPKEFIIEKLSKRNIPRWEKNLLEDVVTITVSEKAKIAHQEKFNREVFTIPNFPLLQEVSKIDFLTPPDDELWSIFIGNDLSRTVKNPKRVTTGLLETVYNTSESGKLLVIGDVNLESNHVIRSIGRKPHLECFLHSSATHVGLSGFLDNPLHYFVSSQKIHLYLHAGCIPVITDAFYRSKTYIQQFALQYKNFKDLKEVLKKNRQYLLNHSPKEVRRYAQKHVIADNYKKILNEAYNQVQT